MSTIGDDAEGGVNNFIQEQAQQPSDALLTLIQLGTEYEFLHSGVPIGQVPKCELHPRGSTALLDAVGRGINETGNRLREISEPDRHGLVIFVFVTDGMENSSHEFTKAQIKEMIERRERQWWPWG